MTAITVNVSPAQERQLYKWGVALVECIKEGRSWSVVSLKAPGTKNVFLAGVTPRLWQKRA